MKPKMESWDVSDNFYGFIRGAVAAVQDLDAMEDGAMDESSTRTRKDSMEVHSVLAQKQQDEIDEQEVRQQGQASSIFSFGT